MIDLDASAIRSMNDYLISRLDGSASTFLNFSSHSLPSQFIIVGSLANRIVDDIPSSTKASTSSSTLRFKLRFNKPINLQIHYSIFEQTSYIKQENLYSWKRHDFRKDVVIIESGSTELTFIDGNQSFTEYSAIVEYNIELDDEGTYNYYINIVNTALSEKRDRFIFNVWMEVDIGTSELVPYIYEYFYEGKKKTLNHFFRTINCSAQLCKNNIIRTSSCPKFELHKIKLKDVDDGLKLSFKNLASDDLEALLDEFKQVLANYLDLYKNTQNPKTAEYEESLKKYDSIYQSYCRGVVFISSNEDVYKAFQLMNEVFCRSSKHSYWRTFQLIFIIKSIYEIINKEKMDVCDVIHIPTGGGKTEAYLGLLIFFFFYERLIGKEIGTIAIVKFPLRMLSIQQMDRVVQKVIVAEDVRINNEIPGDSFSLGFYVGDSTEFPNKTSDAIDDILSKEKVVGKNKVPGKLLKKCPFCGNSVCLKVDSDHHTIKHYCISCEKEFHLYYTDEEIYRYLPSLLVSTVDKFASVALNRYVKAIFGCPIRRCKCGHGYHPSSEGCYASISKQKRCALISDKSFEIDNEIRSVPIVVVQDELHLIRESFGTIDSHFESFCECMQYDFTGKKPKRIAMTATITGCNEQIEQLYCKDVYVFPGYDPNTLIKGGENPFYFEEKNEDGEPRLHRMIVGLKPNVRDNQFALNLTMKYAIDFVEDVRNGKLDLGLGRSLSPDELEHVVRILTKYLTYHNKKGDVRSSKQFMKEVAGDDRGFRSVQKVLTGDNTMDEIREVMSSIYNFQSSESECIHITSATNIVSHGIDIDDWNFMEFQGIPGKTAEYIQAQSRVGRKYCGLIYVWFYPTRVRDLSFYQNFTEYHCILNDMVEPVSINRWTRLGFYETCTSILCATILNYISSIRGTTIYKQEHVRSMLNDDNEDWRKKIIDFINRVYRTDLDEDGSKEISMLIDIEVNDRLNAILNYHMNDKAKEFFPNILAKNSDRYYNTQTGMRGIQDTIVLVPEDSTSFYLGEKNE